MAKESFTNFRTERQKYLRQWEADMLGLGDISHITNDNRPSYMIEENIKTIHRQKNVLPDDFEDDSSE